MDSGPRGVVAALALLLVVALALGTVLGTTGTTRPPDHATAVTKCTTIDEPGYYVIDRDLWHAATDASTPCIRIEASDVVLDGQGRPLTGRGASNTTGILVVGADNVTVKNVSVRDWHRGVHYQRAHSGEVRNVTVRDSVYGLAVRNATGVTVVDGEISGNFVAVETGGDSETTFRNTTVADNHVRTRRNASSGWRPGSRPAVSRRRRSPRPASSSRGAPVAPSPRRPRRPTGS